MRLSTQRERQSRCSTCQVKALEIASLKLMKGDEEMFLEQMLVQSLVNVQLDTMRKSIKPVAIPISTLSNLREFQCLGFNLTDMDLMFKKSMIQLNAAYIKIDNPDVEYCGRFEKAMREGPLKKMERSRRPNS